MSQSFRQKLIFKNLCKNWGTANLHEELVSNFSTKFQKRSNRFSTNKTTPLCSPLFIAGYFFLDQKNFAFFEFNRPIFLCRI